MTILQFKIDLPNKISKTCPEEIFLSRTALKTVFADDPNLNFEFNVDHGLFIGGYFFQDLLIGKTDLKTDMKTFSVNPFFGVEYNLNMGWFVHVHYTFG